MLLPHHKLVCSICKVFIDISANAIFNILTGREVSCNSDPIATLEHCTVVSLQTICTELKHANYIVSFTRKFIQLDLSHFSHVHPYLTTPHLALIYCTQGQI